MYKCIDVQSLTEHIYDVLSQQCSLRLFAIGEMTLSMQSAVYIHMYIHICIYMTMNIHTCVYVQIY